MDVRTFVVPSAGCNYGLLLRFGGNRLRRGQELKEGFAGRDAGRGLHPA